MNSMKLMTIAIVVTSSLVNAEEPPGPTPSPPPVMSTEQAEVSQVPQGFLDQALKVNVKNQITEGRQSTPVTHRQLFERMGRTDLIAQSEARASRRTALALIGGIGGGLAIAAGVIVVATAPVLASPQCESNVTIYNEICVPRAQAHNIAGGALIATGVIAGLLLGTIAYWSDPDVLTRDETASLIGTYNAQLAKRLKQPPSGLKIVPVVTPDGAAVAASMKF